MVASILVIAGTATGALVGLVAAVVISPFGYFSAGAVVVSVAIGLVLDGLNLAVGGLRPPASGRQVPQEWSRLFDPRIVAMLYGARLGVGPLTILSTWTWWSATIAAALVGPAVGAIVGGTFGFVRLAVTVSLSVVSLGAETPSAAPPPEGSLLAESPGQRSRPIRPRGRQPHPMLFAGLRARQRSNWMAINGLGFLALLAVVLAGCSGDAGEAAQSATGSTRPRAAIDHDPAGQDDRTGDDRAAATPAGAGDRSTPAASTDDLETIATVPLEDVVRTVDTEPDNTDTPARAGDRAKPGATKTPRGVPAELDPPTGASGSGGLASGKLPSGATGSAAARPSSAPDALAAALIEAIDGFQPVDEPDADRFLNIAAAAQIQPDPIEELALLETRGFEGGWTRAFLSDTNDVAVASVYQFEDAAEAEFYLEDGLITIGGYGGKFFDVDGQPGVRGFIQYFTENDPSGREELVSLGAAFQAGPRWYLVYFVGSVDTVTPALLIPTIAAQRRTANG